MGQIRIKTSTEEILKGKFSKTISAIESVYSEASNDMIIEMDYSPLAVRNRISKIREAFLQEMHSLAKDITDS